jgi:hypothetical protein
LGFIGLNVQINTEILLNHRQIINNNVAVTLEVRIKRL